MWQIRTSGCQTKNLLYSAAALLSIVRMALEWEIFNFYMKLFYLELNELAALSLETICGVQDKIPLISPFETYLWAIDLKTKYFLSLSIHQKSF